MYIHLKQKSSLTFKLSKVVKKQGRLLKHLKEVWFIVRNRWRV